MKILLLIDHDNHQLKPVNYHTLTAAMQLGDDIDVLVIGHECDSVVEQAKKLPTIKKIWVANAEEYAHQLAENCAEIITLLAKKYDYVIAASNSFGKNSLPRVAALLDVAMISDVIKIISPDTFVRPIYAGNASATVQTIDPIKILSIRTTAFSAASLQPAANVPVEKVTPIIANKLTTFKKQELTISTRPEITAARIIISGGRGLKSAENFQLLEKIADRLGAALGASRAAVDAGFAPNDYQIGQTGKIVAPDLYIAVGISGAIQHLAGMKDSKVIVAINNDPESPIFQVADYGLVMDLFVALPELQAELEQI